MNIDESAPDAAKYSVSKEEQERTVRDIYQHLKKSGIVASMADFSTEWLGMSRAYYHSRQEHVSPAALLTLYTRLQAKGLNSEAMQAHQLMIERIKHRSPIKKTRNDEKGESPDHVSDPEDDERATQRKKCVTNVEKLKNEVVAHDARLGPWEPHRIANEGVLSLHTPNNSVLPYFAIEPEAAARERVRHAIGIETFGEAAPRERHAEKPSKNGMSLDWRLGFDAYLQTSCGLSLDKLLALLDAFGDPGDCPTPRQVQRAKQCRELTVLIAKKLAEGEDALLDAAAADTLEFDPTRRGVE
jgi:hypothetical protein